ncbi:hypothetical protein EX227_22190 [Providencia rettgeri]|uniref:Glycosyltransferase n=1 Tax=Providencia rettgeri TaxID=587 RepID=A0AAP2JXA2_PRORE|nr:hypothetical protein [Providencia rettgeri]MBX6958031.1 hypothetical protein [Providencia rettgeri]MBX6960050.1 hypothetical protein [Providencia rettgeri]MBX6974085.1 hypothetical protein [Providencia rettgeri]MBX6979778.1 hypothetical protein [Providencia rettgeri]MBX6986974.1 hypothetical protein [Providencia rettgeri]
MSKIAYLYKRKKRDSAWSTVISELGDFLQKNHENCHVIPVDNSSLKDLNNSKIDLKNLNLNKNDILIVNHAICVWLFLRYFISLKKRGVKIIFLFHEHEHILGIKYILKNMKNIRIKEWLRHLKFWYRVPTNISTSTICLSSSQAFALNKSNFERISFLGIDPLNFPEKKNNNSLQSSDLLTIMFPHDPQRFDKGNRFFEKLKNKKNFKFIYGRSVILPYNEVFKKYHDSDIIFLPSDSESYSLVLAEALSTNSCIITNANVGIIQLLLSIYTTQELESFGLFICIHSDIGYESGLIKAKTFLKKKQPNTIELFNILRLDKKSAYERLLKYLYRVEKSDV